ncbi:MULTISPECIES: DUF1302 domain-containing protein [Pseudomonas]|uniref:DUF1302 domain-containing protein n=1 Tax=Pseudomonas TaxID=286 RepID=UPI0004D57D5D|nr:MULTISPECIES: DUF1302 domain-containing protein [Pseudomonas]AMO77130.1 hypothetical protein PcP3B5_37170 [Pseudomonas citronellolis]KES22027.1 hypothetical protein FG99_21785 [Pseudomonas sp. AAC]KRV78296.1 adhesin [Pseudomonas citronellolis]KRW79835.1 adhesin [Pseudomonas citronellolis]OHS03844.1 adhesin [Pseudomonas sp. HMSC75E02]
MTRTNRQANLASQVLTFSVVLGLAAPAHAYNFTLGEIEGQLDSSLSFGASWGTSKIDRNLVGINNGGRGPTATGDDGRLNFKRGETFSKIFKGIHDLELKYGDYGALLRGRYWYDFELKDENRPWKDIDDHGRDEGAKASGGEILDAFVYRNYDIGGQPGAVRLGKQVVSWGESTFIANGINAINPVDVSALRRPGAEVKEALIPVNMLSLSQSLGDSLSVDGFYQLEWQKTVVDNCGTFFSSSDVVAKGCNDNNRVGSPAIAPLEPLARAFGIGFDVDAEGVAIPRGKDREARDSGQWGLALRWQTDNVEYGGYFINYHSRTPFLSTRTPSGLLAVAANPAFNAAAGPLAGGLLQSAALGTGQYFLEYPENIRLYGLSFATTLPTGTAWSGEISYRPNAPLQINTTDLPRALLNPISGGLASPTIPTSEGAYNQGYRRKEITQLQTTFTHFFDQVMGAERLTLVGEVAYDHVGGLESTHDLRYGRDPNFGSVDDPAQRAEFGTAGFVTRDSWGYRVRALWDYNNVFAGVNLKPNLAWSQDVDGYGPNGQFNQGAKAASVGLDADYLNTYTASLSYTNFFDGKYNTQGDRDFLALSFGVNF